MSLKTDRKIDIKDKPFAKTPQKSTASRSSGGTSNAFSAYAKVIQKQTKKLTGENSNNNTNTYEGEIENIFKQYELPTTFAGYNPYAYNNASTLFNLQNKTNTQNPLSQNISITQPVSLQTYTPLVPQIEESWSANTPEELSNTLKKLGYDPEFGHILANDAKEHAPNKFLSQCGKHVRQAIERQGDNLGGCGGYSWLMPDKLIAAGWVELDYDGDPNNLPDGVVQIYAPGECGYHKQYGHLQILQRRGDKVVGISDGTVQNVKKGGRYFIKPKTHMSSTMA